MSQSHTISHLLHHLSAVLGRETDQILQEQLGLTFAQYKMLVAISANPRVQQRYIALSLGQTEASISRQIKLLERKALIVVRTNPQNRREHLTQLTAKGLRLTEAATQVVHTYELSMLGRLHDKHLQQLSALLRETDQHVCTQAHY